MKFLEDTVAMITGGAQGLGLAIAEELAKAGAKIAIVDINESKLNESINNLKSLGHKVYGVICDVSKTDDVERAVKEVLKQFKKIDILINNAAIAPDTPFLECSSEQWDKVMAINLKGYFNCSQSVVRHMIKNNINGRIVNLTSTLGLRPKANLVAYTTSKGAIINLTQTMAVELGEYGIRVNAIAPGMIDTPMTAKGFINPMIKNIILGGIPMKRLGTPEEIGKAAVFLSSDYSSFVSGTILVVDGGQNAGMPSRIQRSPDVKEGHLTP